MNVIVAIVGYERVYFESQTEEFLKFLRTIDREVPNGLAVHLILDNYATHKHPDVARWL